MSKLKRTMDETVGEKKYYRYKTWSQYANLDVWQGQGRHFLYMSGDKGEYCTCRLFASKSQRVGMVLAHEVDRKVAKALAHLNLKPVYFVRGHMNLQGGDDLGTVVVQVFGASAIGVLLAGLMIFSRSIWVPIIFHALYNLPFAQFDSVNTGHSAIPISYLIWLVGSALLQIATGVLLIYFADREPVAIKRWLVKFKLIEEVRHG